MLGASTRTSAPAFLAALTALATIAVPASAQVSFYAASGGVATELSGDDVNGDFDSDGGFFVLGGLGIPLGETFGISGSASFQERGWIETGVQKVETDYVGLALSVTARIPLGEQLSLGLGAGPRLNIKAKCEITDRSSTYNCDNGGNINPFVDDYGVGGYAGLGFSVNERLRISGGGSYELGLRSLAEFQNGPRVGESYEAKWRAMAAWGAISLALGGGA